jgi:iron complex outermembrane receptor protein
MKLSPLYLAMSASLLTSTCVFAETIDEEQQNHTLDKVTVTGEALGRYAVADAPSTTRSNVPVMETSRSIQVIDQNFINDADIQSLEDALKYVSGTSPALNLGGVDTHYFVRGFAETYTYRNGKRELLDRGVNMKTVETVEVLKGPSSVRFGVNSPGGIVNYTTKAPQADTQRSVKARVDEHGQKELVGDFTGAANDAGTVLYRFIAAGENSESFRDFSEEKSLTIAPSLTFLLSDKTRLTTSYELQKSEVPIDRGIPIGELSDGSYVIADVPIERKYNEKEDRAVEDMQLFDITLAHQFNGNWQGEISYAYQKLDSEWSNLRARGVDIDTGLVARKRVGYINIEHVAHQVSSLVHGDFELAGIQHKVTVGADYSNSDLDNAWGQVTTEPVPDLNIYDPVYGGFSTELTKLWDETVTVDTQGLFASETAYLGDKLVVNVATRYDFFEYNLVDVGVSADDDFEIIEKDEALTWNAGLLYKMVPAASLYLSYATSYKPNEAVDLVGQLEPQEGEQWEVGIKGLAMNDSLQYSVVFYDITKSNIPDGFEDENEEYKVRLIGEQTSQGVELDTTWQVSDAFSLLASYAYTDAKVSKNKENPEFEGNALAGVAENSAALFMSYAYTPSLAILGGVNYADDVASRSDDRHNGFEVPGATVYDLGLKYSHFLANEQAVLLQTGIKNLTDERIYIQTGQKEVGIGQPRTLYANVEYQF